MPRHPDVDGALALPPNHVGRAQAMRVRENLDRDPRDDEDLLDPDDAVRALRSTADTLDRWHRDGARGPRPPGRLRPHRPEELSLHTRLWAVPLYRLVYDPDGRPWRDRLRNRW